MTRVTIRLVRSLAADQEIHAVLPDDLERLEREHPELAALVEAEPLGPGARSSADAGKLEGSSS